MDIVCTDQFRYEIQELVVVPVWYTGIYRPISSTDTIQTCITAQLF
jgi:hypothetical protein